VNAPIAPVSFDVFGAGNASGVSVDVIRRAVRAGDLPVHYPNVNGRQVNKPLILADDLRAWVERGKTERVPA
jgi:hypothetical protein